MTSTTPHHDTDIANVDQAAAWNGQEGAHWATHRDEGGGLEAVVLDAARLTDGSRVLEVGCGTGEMARMAARRVGRGGVVGLDLSGLMLDLARRDAAAEGLANVRFEQGDAQVHPLPPASFDAVVSHFGVMFFADPVAAFANLRGALVAGGRLAVVVPAEAERCDWYVRPLQALLGPRPSLGTEPSPMFSLADPRRSEAVLRAAGFEEVAVEAVDATLRFGVDVETAVRFFLGAGPAAAAIEAAGLDEGEARRRLTEVLAPALGPDGVRLPGAHWLLTARAPG